jgi:hypothetical protein
MLRLIVKVVKVEVEPIFLTVTEMLYDMPRNIELGILTPVDIKSTAAFPLITVIKRRKESNIFFMFLILDTDFAVNISK